MQISTRSELHESIKPSIISMVSSPDQSGTRFGHSNYSPTNRSSTKTKIGDHLEIQAKKRQDRYVKDLKKREVEMYNYNQLNNDRGYKNYQCSFIKDTIDYHVGKDSLEPWDKNSLTNDCNDNFEHILRNNDYTHVFQISKRFLKFFECNGQTEFEEKVLIPILRKLCIKYGQILSMF